MSRNLFLVVTTLALCGFSTVLTPRAATADTPLSRASIQALLNKVRLMPRNQTPRQARIKDLMGQGDALSTARSSRAELRFNDGSLARVGELALFRFTPGTRNFRLSNGTLLLLVPPGRGRTNVNTPNASAGIRGSALFVRYDEKTDTTIVGALTNNPQGPMEILSRDGSKQDLRAGQMVVIVKNKIDKLFEFDLRTFYETSDIVKGLDLPRKETAHSDKEIAAVQGETAEAVDEQAPIQANSAIENPKFVTLSPIVPEFYEEPESLAGSSPGVQIPINGFPGRQPQDSQPLSIDTPSTQPPVQTPVPIITPPTQPPVQTPTPIVTPPTQPPVQTPAPIVTPSYPPTQAPSQPPRQQLEQISRPPAAQQAPTPVITPPVQTPTPVITPPVQTPAPVVTPLQTPAPVITPSYPPTQAAQQTPAVQIQIAPQIQVPTPTPNPVPEITQTTAQPAPTLAPALAPSVTPESPASTGQTQIPNNTAL